MLAADLGGTWWQYALLFVAVAMSWAGVPFIGATALGAAAIAASQGRLDLTVVVVVATVAGEVGGMTGYSIGNRWGRVLLERPGKHQAGRRRMVEKGERAYAKWGRLAVFFTPAIVSGTAEMPWSQFVRWNLLAAFGFAVSVSLSSYGIGRLLAGDHSLRDILTLVVGLAAGVLVVYVAVRRHKRRIAARPDQPT